MDNTKVSRDGNIIFISGSLYDFRRLLSEIHKAIFNAGYTDIQLDFSKCTAAFQSSMLGICAQILKYTHEGISFSLNLRFLSRICGWPWG